MKRSAFISDIIFAFFTAFLFTICLFRYVKIALLPAILLSVLCGALAAGAIGAALQSKRKTFFLKKSDEAQKEKLLLHLAFLSDEGKTQFFLERLSGETPAKRFGRLRVYTPEAFYLLRFSLAPVVSDDILNFSRLKTGKQKILLCSKIEESAHTLCEKLGIKVQTGEQVYAALKEQNALPETYLGEESAEKKRKRRLHLWFSRSNAKRFLVSAALVLLTALLSPFPYYYLVFGGILLLTTILVRIFGYE